MWGDLQWHVGVDPAAAETQVRGENLLIRIATAWGEPARDALVGSCVGCRVACLAWGRWDGGFKL